MSSWSAFERDVPEFGSAGRRLLIGSDGVAIGFLASASGDGTPHLSPVCPIFSGDNLYVSAGRRTPKAADLRDSGRYVLHAFLGANDEEFQIAGRAVYVSDAAEREQVQLAISFGSFNAADPIFLLSIDRALWVYWERVGQPDTRAIRKRWSRPCGATRPCS
jgi:hypothetical protein